MDHDYIPSKTRRVDQDDANDVRLSEKSLQSYHHCYELFVEWQKQQNTTSTSEDTMLLYFEKLSKEFKPSSLWAKYSMIKHTVRKYHDVHLSEYRRLTAFLTKNCKGYEPSRSKSLESKHVEKFLTDAPDDRYLAMKVALIFGVVGGCRREQLKKIKVQDIEHHGDVMLVKTSKPKTDVPRKFIVDGEFLEIVKRYEALRPNNAWTDDFFLTYRNGKCTIQPIGINTFGAMPRIIAEYLKLEDPKKYTGHSFRRTSASILANSGADIQTLKQRIGWKSDRVAREFVYESTGRATSNQTRSQAFSYVDVPNFTGFNNTEIGGPSTAISAQQSFWPHQATVCLIAQYKKFHSMADPAARLKNGESLFEMISSEMQKYGFYFDPQKCENEWRILEKKYKSLFCNEAIKESGGMTHYMEWEHKKSMDEIFNEKNEQSSLEESHFPAASTASEIAQNDDQGDYSSHFSTPSTATEMNRIDDQGDYSSLPEDHTEFDYEDVEMDKPDISMMSEVSPKKENVSVDMTAPLFQTLLAEMNQNFLRAEEKKAERHKEKMAMRQQELEISKELLKLKKEKMELWKKQMLATGHLNVSETSK